MNFFERLVARMDAPESGLQPRVRSVFEPESPEPLVPEFVSPEVQERHIDSHLQSVPRAVPVELPTHEIAPVSLEETLVESPNLQVVKEEVPAIPTTIFEEVVVSPTPAPAIETAHVILEPGITETVTEHAVREIRSFEQREIIRSRKASHHLTFESQPQPLSQISEPKPLKIPSQEAREEVALVEIRIGRIDVHFDSPKAPNQPPRPIGQLKVSLEDHLRVRNGGNA